jgi:hypothetical protein
LAAVGQGLGSAATREGARIVAYRGGCANRYGILFASSVMEGPVRSSLTI